MVLLRAGLATSAVPAHLVVEDGRAVRYTRMPEREEIPVDVNVPFIVEFYAQRV